MRRARVATVATVLAAGFVVPGGAAATPAAPSDLRAVDGDGWSAEYRFAVAWRNPTVGTPITAVHFRVRGPSGDVEVGPTRIGWAVQSTTVAVARAGVSTLEVWLEDATGEGPAAALPLRYDPTAPPPVAPVEPTGWIGHAELPLSVRSSRRRSRPSRGFAVTRCRSTALPRAPMRAGRRCTEDETDLRGGPGDDALVLDSSPTACSTSMRSPCPAPACDLPRSGRCRSASTRSILTPASRRPASSVRAAVASKREPPDPPLGMVPRSRAIPYTAIRVDDGAPTVAAGAAVRATVIAEASTPSPTTPATWRVTSTTVPGRMASPPWRACASTDRPRESPSSAAAWGPTRS